jgi:signal transduction histidine kinase
MLAIGIIISIILQFSAAILAFSLIRQTKYNISWILISIAFLLLSVSLGFELFKLLYNHLSDTFIIIGNGMSIFISLLFFVGVIFIKKIFNLQKRIDELRKQSENRVLNAIIITEERERQRFAKDLHDGLGPLLSMMKMSVSALLKAEMKASDKEIIVNVDALVTESITAIREVSNNLSPHILDNFGLISAINSFVAKITKNSSVQINVFSNKSDIRLDYNKEVVLYRVLLELISNTLKHAVAQNIGITILFNEKQVLVEYKDDGKGFDIESVSLTHTGMGLSNISSRIKSIQGELEIQSKTNNGVVVFIKVTI